MSNGMEVGYMYRIYMSENDFNIGFGCVMITDTIQMLTEARN